jgi:hypothetical protein
MQLEQHPPPWLSGAAAAALAGLLVRLGLAASGPIRFSPGYVMAILSFTNLSLFLLSAEY